MLRLHWYEPSRYPSLVQVTRGYELPGGSIVLVPTYVKPSELADELKKISVEMGRIVTQEAFDRFLHKCYLPIVQNTDELSAAITERYSNDYGLPVDEVPAGTLN